MKQLYLLILVNLCLATQNPLFSQVSGYVHRYSSPQLSRDRPIGGFTKVSVRAYDAQGKFLTSASSDAMGYYQLDVPDGQRVRLEFDQLPQGFSPAPGQSRVKFLTSPASANLDLWQPGQFVGGHPRAVQSLYTTSNPKKTGEPQAALVSYQAGDSTTGKAITLANSAQVGSLWGIAYDRTSRRLFATAFAKRHSPAGPLGLGGIYVINPEKQDVKPFVDLSALGIPAAPANYLRDVSSKESVFSHDSLMFSFVGKTGLGGIDVSDDGRDLWVINLFDRKLYKIALSSTERAPTAADIAGYAVPSVGRNGVTRPFAVKFYGGKVYVGIVSDATGEKAKDADLSATVLAFDPVRQKFETVFSMPLNYTRGTLDYGVSGWRPWTDDYQKAVLANNSGWMIYPQPILADIEFDTDGSMILGLMDRLGHQTGEGQLYRPKGMRQLQQVRGLAGGDVLRVAYRGNERATNRYELEHNGQAGDRISAGQGNGEGPQGGEFYFGDAFKASGITWHQETAAGGLALLPDQDQLLVAAREPEQGGYLGGGVKWFDNSTGAAVKGLSLLPKNQTNPFGKSNNVGDIELITEVPPTEIGDRIWQDCDEDGIQDADETALANINVGLFQGDALLATVRTDSLGHYAFNDTLVLGGIKPRTAYELRVAIRQAAYAELKPTNSLQGSNREIDSDAMLINQYAVIKFTTNAPGENIHDLDFGFRCLDKPQVTARLTAEEQADTLDLENRGLVVSPNPASDYVLIRYRSKNNQGSIQLVLTDINGRPLMTQRADLNEGRYQSKFNLTHQPPGSYIIAIQDGNMKVSETIIKQ
ncbi:T9SS type A sorting domain-containing protein [Dyadobacter sp. CY261]|uniref:SdrD B-like domain-containing protein n=1 Tax=Dyadobacter sp. CY261 TaxID=2907203 RepID=UPI001F41271B|nr:SdrD B-like domain-containing protein [Dyadobacter sp. CY261]MCF0070784.1 T9SS type A sorting domain-containing protein [Dyadobacter sp. CY261]